MMIINMSACRHPWNYGQMVNWGGVQINLYHMEKGIKARWGYYLQQGLGVSRKDQWGGPPRGRHALLVGFVNGDTPLIE